MRPRRNAAPLDAHFLGERRLARDDSTRSRTRRRGPAIDSAGAAARARGASTARRHEADDGCSAYAWQQFAFRLRHEPAAKSGVQNHHARDGRRVQVPTIAASRPSGCARSAARTASAASGANADQRLAFVRDEQRIDPDQLRRRRATRARTGSAASSSTMPTPLFAAISCSALATPPRVGSFIAVMRADAPRRSAARIRPLSGATSDWRSASSVEAVPRRHHRHPVIAERAGDDDPVARPQAAVAHEAIGQADAGGVDDDAVDLALAHHLRVAGEHDGATLRGRPRASTRESGRDPRAEILPR